MFGQWTSVVELFRPPGGPDAVGLPYEARHWLAQHVLSLSLMRKSILIVDDELKVRQALHRLLTNMGDDWNLAFAENGVQALQTMSMTPFDVVVSDLVMPGMDGAELLTEVMHRYPKTARIILCRDADRAALPCLFGIAHQYLIKPCDAKMLRDTLARVLMRGELLADEKLKSLVSQLKVVPSLPTLYVDLMKEMRSDTASLQKAGEIIARDPGMSAKLLQLVNSAFFGFFRKVANPEEAALYLGLETIKALVLSLQAFTSFDRFRIRACNLDALWNHCWETGVLARRIWSAESGDASMLDQAFTGGLLHDIGKLVLADNQPELYQKACLLAHQENMSLAQAEQQVFGVSHAEVGGYLLGLWGLPDPIVEAVAYHHSPAWSSNKGFAPVTAVHVADVLSHERPDKAPVAISDPVDLDYLAACGLMERFASWQEMCWNALNQQEALSLEACLCGN
jgi:putative nucleotidyltransferase with HDIG domain